MEETPEQGVEGFTPKAPAIESLMESVAGRSRESGHCVFEDRYPDKDHDLNFRTPLDRKEYSISGLCQTCQDEVFQEPEEEPPPHHSDVTESCYSCGGRWKFIDTTGVYEMIHERDCDWFRGSETRDPKDIGKEE